MSIFVTFLKSIHNCEEKFPVPDPVGSFFTRIPVAEPLIMTLSKFEVRENIIGSSLVILEIFHVNPGEANTSQ